VIVYLTRRHIDDGERDGDTICVTADEVTGRGCVMFDIPADTAPGTVLLDPDDVVWLTDVCGETARRRVSPDPGPDSIEYQRRFEERAAEQLRAHLADPYNVPMAIPADDDEFPSDYTVGSPEEEDS
jgi:hypothetical protein